jgi:hypothetical protein
LAPAKAMSYSRDAGHWSNCFTNIAPQDPYTNRQPWKNLEAKIYQMAAKYESKKSTGIDIYVYTGVCGSQGNLDGVTIPKYFWKALCAQNPDTGKWMTIGFRGDNSDSGKVVRGGTTVQHERAEDVYKWRTASAAFGKCDYGSNPFGVDGFKIIQCGAQANQQPDKKFWSILDFDDVNKHHAGTKVDDDNSHLHNDGITTTTT